MRHFSSVLIGTVTLLLPLQVALGASSSSAPATLYDRIKQTVEREEAVDGVEPEIAAYVKAYMKTLDVDITIDDVTAAMRSESWTLCGKREFNDPSRSRTGCDDLTSRIRTMILREQHVRHLGRDLQLTATSFELPISDLPGRSHQLSTDLRAIVSLWIADGAPASSSTSSSPATQAAPIRTVPVDEGEMEPLVQNLGTRLSALPKEELTAAIWRYQYGVRLIRDDRAPDYPAPHKDTQSGEGTERQFIFKQWPDIEQALMDIWDKVEDDTFNPPLAPNESVLYTFPANLLKNSLPDNVIVWIRMDGNRVHPLGDVGLQWGVPLEPVLPSLLNPDEKMILGGNYPPEPIKLEAGEVVPVDGEGLCTNPTAKRGYLCRPFTPAAGERCPDDPANPVDPDKITLSTCEQESTARTTLAGADVCRDINYKATTFDPQTQCIVDFACRPDCVFPPAAIAADASAVTSGKNGDGVIKICESAASPDIPEPYLAYHEIHHAYQECALPPNTEWYKEVPPGASSQEKKDIDVANAETCCEVEGEAYRAQCDLMAQDGLFSNGFLPMDPVDGIPFNAETCAEAWTNATCKNRYPAKACYTSRTYTDDFKKKMFTVKNTLDDAPLKCKDLYKVVDGKKVFTDQRVQDLIDAVNHRTDICQPGQVDIYKNRIGNNMCYIGQCIEESVELHRMTGAQSPATVGDESFPWNDPQTGAPLGNALLNPPLTPAQLPLYHPQWIVEQLEEQLCQLQGLPPLTPSILCTYKPSRRLSYPVIDPITNAQSLLLDAQSQRETTNRTLSLTLGLGSRLGTAMYADYLGTASHSLADVLGMAVKLFKEMSSVDFPTVMCPAGSVLPPPASNPT